MRKIVFTTVFLILALVAGFAQNSAPNTPNSSVDTPSQNSNVDQNANGQQPAVNQSGTVGQEQDVQTPQQPQQPQQSQGPMVSTRQGTSQTANNGGTTVAPGTEIQAALDTALSTTNNRVGDQFTATIVQPVRDANGAVVIPAGAKVRGEVSESEQGKTLPEIRGKGRLNLR